MPLKPPPFASFHDAYLAVLEAVTAEPEYTTSSRGNDSVEITNVSFRLTDPRNRLPFLERRAVNVVYNIAEALWYAAGRDDLDMIGYYAPGMAAYSADGKVLTGTAYGTKLFTPDQDNATQWARVLELLRADPGSKRAVLAIYRAEELAVPDNPDVSCTIAAQFLLRAGRLNLTCYMRGNDAYMGMVSDVFAFTFLQEVAARELGVELGHYTHHVGSMHVNDRDAKTVRRLLNEPRTPGYVRPDPPLPTMGTGTSMAVIAQVLEHEEALRTDRTGYTPAQVAALPLPAYWQQVVLLFEVYRQIKHTDGPVGAAHLEVLDPAYRWLIARRWKNRMPAQVAA
ncbi:thymidylate synthase [Nocardiopsis changdeensis]|uniref:thymidylate synthase n=1 Tax=Nocardiopsis changdeensis TaxID=2831969 RepID=A0ABX8BED4_9ACTN|nr:MULTISPECIES: thymidylate synthase [Nocardiopsis]QUX20611.1 thymidylate synthase [Nocardiopsis changdeensis]QYX36542.1 thymidylate synthase [Nocardiopsis sp. MT53]